MPKLQSVGSVAGKETIYVDVDDEITAIIDKVHSAKGKVIALVLPKRATVLQSIVNMKLLKRTADDASKNLVLVTSEAGLMPLAGSVGLHVAATPSSRPEIPTAPAGPDDGPEDIDEPLNIVDGNAPDDDFDAKAARGKTVGELAVSGAAGKTSESDIDDSIDMNDESDASDEGSQAGKPLVKPKKNRKLAVPNFDSLRKKIALGVLALALLITGWIFAFVVLPKAAVTIKTDTSNVATNLGLVLDTSAKTLNTENNVIPATQQTQQKTDTQQAPATGQQNNGNKASGAVTVVNCSGDDIVIQAGTSLSSSGHTFIAQSSVAVPDSNYTSPINGSKCKNDGKAQLDVSALHGGADYNLSSASFTIPSQSNVSATGSTTGGTDNIIKIVSQSDIDNATNKIKSGDTTAVKQQLASGLQAKGLQAVDSTFLAGDPQVTTSAKAGDTADNVTVTVVTSYTMLGVKKSDLTTLVEANVDKQIDKRKQVILDNGVANAKFTQQSPGSATGANVSMSTHSIAGPQLDTASLKKQIKGMKSGDIKGLIKQTPGVTEVSVKFSPAWVNTAPKKDSKITITIDKSGV
jgi:hypothetical protein